MLIVLFIPAAYLANRWSAQAARDRDEARVLRRLESNMAAELESAQRANDPAALKSARENLRDVRSKIRQLEEAAARPWMQPLAAP